MKRPIAGLCLVTALVVPPTAYGQNSFRDLVKEVGKEVLRDNRSDAPIEQRRESGGKVDGRVVDGLIYRAPAAISPRWVVNDFTPEQLNGYTHIRFGGVAPAQFEPNRLDQGSRNCEPYLLGAALLVGIRTITDDEIDSACGHTATFEYAKNRFEQFRNTRKFYYRASDQFLDIRWNSYLNATVVSIPQFFIMSPWRGVDFHLEGRHISNLYWSPSYSYPIAKPPVEHPNRISPPPMFQVILSNPRDDFPRGDVYNTIYFTITGDPRPADMSSNITERYIVPVSIDKIEIADRNGGLVLDYTK